MATVTVQTVFLASIIILKYMLGLRMVFAAPFALLIATGYMAVLYPRAWRVFINTLPRDINVGSPMCSTSAVFVFVARISITICLMFGFTDSTLNV
ncbi:unnamed protein product [Notodromas monacha]|uniref:Uncharacterized protein n=1 Tax=Notodromas monacha TaxID=399045 RepID=A0A7R9BJG6_9CRUS|nr:unnamed protein product [Notodromas monacha]CAG0915878.1 unnamed protein product [Notodromas monacha]